MPSRKQAAERRSPPTIWIRDGVVILADTPAHRALIERIRAIRVRRGAGGSHAAGGSLRSLMTAIDDLLAMADEVINNDPMTTPEEVIDLIATMRAAIIGLRRDVALLTHELVTDRAALVQRDAEVERLRQANQDQTNVSRALQADIERLSGELRTLQTWRNADVETFQAQRDEVERLRRALQGPDYEPPQYLPAVARIVDLEAEVERLRAAMRSIADDAADDPDTEWVATRLHEARTMTGTGRRRDEG